MADTVVRPRRRAQLVKRLLLQPEISGVVMLLLIAGGFAFTANNFISLRSLSNILNILPELGLVTLGGTILIIAGEFDLSVGSVFGLVPMLMLWAIGHGVPEFPAILMALLLGALVGTLNGVVTLRFGIPSFITTLGMLFVARSLTIIIGNLAPPAFPEDLPVGLFVARMGLVQASVLWLVAICLIAGVVLHRTKFGNWIYATGGQLQAARDMGIDVRAVKIACFTLCSLLAGFAGLIQCFRLQAPLASAGDGIELQAIAGAVIGGTALSGGVGSVLGAILGTVLIRVIDNGMTMSRVDANWFQLAIGVLTVVSVIVNVVIRGRAAKNTRMTVSGRRLPSSAASICRNGMAASTRSRTSAVEFGRGAEVVGLLGDNGAGKSTLIKILSGAHRADSRTHPDRRRGGADPLAARFHARGIETIYQYTAMVPQMSIARNIFIGREPTLGPRIGPIALLDRGLMAATAMQALRDVDLQLRSADTPVEELSGGERQGVAIARAMHFKSRLLILDEPTNHLSLKETTKVLDHVATLRAQGVSSIFISHNLHHIHPIADRMVIMARGEVVAEVARGEMSVEEIARLIV